MTKAGSGNLTISAANTYGGTTTISGGTLTAGAVNTLPTGTAVVLSNSTVSDLASPFAAITTALNLNGNSQTIGSLAGGGTFGGNVLLGSATLTTGGANSSTSYGGIISGAGGGLTKAGTGVFTVTGANTYTGATTVSAGTLLVSGTGSINSTSGIVIASNSILRYNSITAYSGGAITNSGVISGSGNLGSTVLGGSGSIDPGNSPGILTAGSTNPTGGLDYNFEFTAKNASPTWSNATDSGNDVLRLTGGTPFSASLTTSNVISLYLNVTSLAENDVFTGGFFTDNNASFLASISGADTKYYLMNAGGGTPYNGVNYNLYSGSLTFTMATVAKTADFASGTIPGYSMQFTAVPEPATWALLAFSLTTVMVLRRRHRE
jgi:autotransporter-associated beta strand protein